MGHVVGRSQEMAAIFFDAVLPLRLGAPANAASAAPLKALDERSGILGDLVKRKLRRASDSPAETDLTAWFPSERTANAWQALLMREPFEH